MFVRVLALLVAATTVIATIGSVAAGAETGNQADASANTPPPLEAFAQLPFIVGPQLSPNGQQVAARIAIKGVQRFVIMPLADITKTAIVGLGDNDLNSWTWVNDNWIVARIGSIQSVQGNDWYIRRALGIQADGKKFTVLGKDSAQSADDILWVASDGTPQILLASQTSIYYDEVNFWPVVRRYDISTGKGRDIVRPLPGVMNWYADGEGAVRMGISYYDNTRSYRLLYRDDDSKQFKTVNRVQGKNTGLRNVPAMFLADRGKAIVFSNDDGFNALYNYDLTSQSVGKRLFGITGYDVGQIITDATGTSMIGARYTDTRNRTHWFDPKLSEIQALIDKAVNNDNAQIVSWSRDFSTLIVLVSNGSRMGAYYIFRPSEGRMRIFARVGDTLGAKAYAPVSTIKFTARDKLEISGVLTLPRGVEAKNLPFILMPHGGPAARDDESWDWWAQFLASRGYAVLQPNYRGSTGFGSAFQDKGKGAWGLAMQDDLTDAVKWATSSGLADAKRVCIIGGSYGGYAALRAAQRDTGVYRCAVSFAGVSDIPAMLRHDSQFLNGQRSQDYLREQAPDLKNVSPINFAGDFSIPVLMVHGKRDKVVPVKQSREMAEKLKAAGKPFRYVEQQDGDHHFSNEVDRVQFLKELEAFLKINNPA